MEEYKSFETISEYNRFYNNDTRHPLVGIIDYAKSGKLTPFAMRFGFYAIMIKEVHCGEFKYGRSIYDYDEDTLAFVGPGQVVRFTLSAEPFLPKGAALIFHPDLLHGTSLAHQIYKYSFFDYAVNEALHISKEERETIVDCFSKITAELHKPIDKHTKKVVVSNIELLLNYCERFYDRQFITREIPNSDILEQFERLLKDYYHTVEADEEGLPSVQYFAEKLSISPNYFGDLIKKVTGISAQEHIHLFIADEAKNRIYDTTKSVKEISYELGFKHPQHFIRFFKKRTGATPVEFRNHN